MPSDLGRKSIAIDQPGGGGDDYPFLGRSELSDLIADLYLSYRDDVCAFVRPFSIKWLYGFGDDVVAPPFLPVHDYDLLIVDAENQTVFDSREADSPELRNWNDRLQIMTWVNTADEAVLRVVRHMLWGPNDTPITFPTYLVPEVSQLDPRSHSQLLARVRSLRLESTGPQQYRLRLRNGFNTQLTTVAAAVANGKRLQTTLTLDVAPGLGLGKFQPECDEASPLLRSINGQTGDASGNVRLDAVSRQDAGKGGCYRIERPQLAVVQSDPVQLRVQDHALQFGNDCQPCCTCEDFINTYEGIRRLRDRYAGMYERAIAARDKYVQNRQRFAAQRDCRLQSPLRIIVRPVCPDEIAIAIGFCNLTDACLTNLIVPISFEYTGEGLDIETVYAGDEPTVACNSTFRSGNVPDGAGSAQSLDYYKLGGAWPHYYAAWDRVDPGSLAQVTFRVRFADSEAGDQLQMIADAYAVAEPGGSLGGPAVPIPGYVPGTGPTTPEAADARLVEAPVTAAAGLLQGDCCDDEA